MYKFEFGKIKTDPSLFLYFFSTLFMVFFSIHAIHNWTNRWAQITISLACILATLPVLIKNIPNFLQSKNWSKELKLVLVIVALGALNIYFSEDSSASLKGMGLFLMSGTMIFGVTCILFRSRSNQSLLFNIFSIFFITLVVFGIFEFTQQLSAPGKRIVLFSSNPISAGSLLILLSTGPLFLLTQNNSSLQKGLLIGTLILGAIIIILIGQRGPVLAILVMAFFWATTRKKLFWIFTLIAVILLAIGYQFRGKIPLHYKNQLFNKETVLVRLEFYNVAWQVIKDKPFFGIGFNAPITKYITKDYKPKFYPKNSRHTFPSIITGVETFDNMALFFMAQTGLLFTGVYVCLIFYLIKNLTKKNNKNFGINLQGKLLLIVLIGFAVHSMTYDSLRYPHLNWIFHSLLGLMANCSLFHQGKPCQEDGLQQE